MTRAAAALLVAALLWGCGGDGDDPLDREWRLLLEDLDGAVLSVWGTGPDDVFAVGGTLEEGGGRALVLWYDGQAWWRMPVDAPTLWWVHGFAHDDVWAVGDRGTILHFDGEAWTTVDTGHDYTLWGVWGATPAELWTVGGEIASERPGVLRRYADGAWTDVEGVGLPGELLFKVWGASAAEAFIVGDGGALLAYNGAAWTRLDAGTGERLLTVRGRGADDVYAVGGVLGPVMLHRDAGGWAAVDVGIEQGLMGVWTAPDEPVVAVGFRGVIVMGDGATWREQAPATYQCLHAVWGDGAGVYLAGGGDLISSTASRGVIVATGDIAGGPVNDW